MKLLDGDTLTENVNKNGPCSVNLSTANLTKSALDILIEELQADDWKATQFEMETRSAVHEHGPKSEVSGDVSRAIRAPCGSLNCAGCYEVALGVWIHPPKCGEDYRAWLERWEAKGKIQ